MHHRAVALVEPFRLHALFTFGRLAAFHTHAEHLHAVAEGGDVAANLLVHGVARVGAAQVGQAGAGDVAVGRVLMVERRQRRNGGVSVYGAAGAGLGQFGQARLAADGLLAERIGAGVAVDLADRVLLDDADAAFAGGVLELNE